MAEGKAIDSTAAPSLRRTLLWGLALYAVLVAPGAILNWDGINVDGVSYLRLASYVAEGRLADSMSSHWSPLISWLVAPLLAAGIDGLHAAHLVLLAVGAGFMMASALFLRRMTHLGRGWTLVVLALLAVMAADFSVSTMSPDLLMAAILMLYFCCVTDRRLLDDWRLPAAAGLLGAVAYLGKAYALPFFLIHFPLTLILQYRWRRAEVRSADPAGGGAAPVRWRRVMAVGAAGLLACALVAGPWIGALSWKYGHLTATSAGSLNHALTGPGYPEGMGRPHPCFVGGLFVPPPGRLTLWETPEVLSYKYWSPFENAAALRYQVKQVVKNAWSLQHVLCEVDVFGLTLALIGVSPLLVYLLRGRPHDQFKMLWLVGTILFYSSGFLLVYVEGRYVMPVLWPVACILLFHIAWLVREKLREARSASLWRPGILAVVPALILAVSFGVVPAGKLASVTLMPDANHFRQVAERAREAGCAGPVAGSSFSQGLYVAYHLDLPYLGRPLSTSPEECGQELDRFGVKTFLVWRGSPFWGVFGQVPTWKKVAELQGLGDASGEAVEIYAKQAADAPPGG
jgi:hypothetical protein